uniref:Uncharacterized protein n=1 Tax=Lepeophtheirus salmonis TaxID=72036 RepID=A0A0K2V8E8_LEPSM
MIIHFFPSAKTCYPDKRFNFQYLVTIALQFLKLGVSNFAIIVNIPKSQDW